jgi:hypothetical protein
MYSNELNPVTRYKRLWCCHSVPFEGGKMELRVDLGFPFKHFVSYPHCLMLRNHGELADECRLESDAKASGARGYLQEAVYLGYSQFADYREWCFWCSTDFQSSSAPNIDKLADEVFYKHNDFGVFYRDCLLPEAFKNEVLTLEEIIREFPVDANKSRPHRIRHWLIVPRGVVIGEILPSGFSAHAVEELGANMRVCISEVSDLRLETRHMSLASIFCHLIPARGRYEGWEVEF